LDDKILMKAIEEAKKVLEDAGYKSSKISMNYTEDFALISISVTSRK